MTETLFNDVQSRIAERMPWLKGQVDEDYGQLEMLYREDADSDTYPLIFPLVLIDAPTCEWSTLNGVGVSIQDGVCRIVIKLAIDCYDDTHYTSGTADKAKERMQKNREVNRALQLFKPEGAKGPMLRVSSRNYTMPHGIKVYEQTYECKVRENLILEEG